MGSCYCQGRGCGSCNGQALSGFAPGLNISSNTRFVAIQESGSAATDLTFTAGQLANFLFQSVNPNPVIISIDDDFLVGNEDYILGIDGITVTLPASAIKPVTIVGTSGTIVIDGNGSTIDGQPAVSLTNSNSYTLVPFAGDWRIV